MSSNVLGGGILFAAIALLWVLVLVPSFVRGREFRAAEQNAARLQRTLRLLAETAQVPEEHHLEANAREALAHEKKLKQARRHQQRSRRTQMQQLRVEQRIEQMKAQRELADRQALLRQERLRSKKYKPLRIAAALVSVLSVAGLLVGIGLLIAGLGALTVWISLFGLALGTGVLVRLAPGAQKNVATMVPEKSVQTVSELPEIITEAEMPSDDSALAHAAAQLKAKQELERAKVLAEARAKARAMAEAQTKEKANQPGSMLLSAEASNEEKSIAGAKADPLTERLKKMGVVEEETPATNIDEILKRRRQAG